MCSSSRRCARRTSPPTRIWSSSSSHSMVMDGSRVGCLGWVGKRRKDWGIFWPMGGGRRKRNGDGRLLSDARQRQEARGRDMRVGTTTRRREGGVRRHREERARGRRRGLEEIGCPRHLPGQLRVLGFTGSDTECRYTPSRSSDPLNSPVPGAMQLPVAVSLRLNATVPSKASQTL
jgi:hypothetical protein